MSALESHLEESKRHVAENAGRITKQKELIAELRRNSHGDLLRDAERLLQTFEDTQRIAIEHLETEQKKVTAWKNAARSN